MLQMQAAQNWNSYLKKLSGCVSLSALGVGLGRLQIFAVFEIL